MTETHANGTINSNVNPQVDSKNPQASGTQLALLFPGQGSQAVGMGRAFYDTVPAARAIFQEADDALGFALSRLIFEGPEDQLKLTEHTQPAILTTSIAILRALEPELKSRNLTVAFAAGHSLGEYSAHVAAGTFTFADAVRTLRSPTGRPRQPLRPGRPHHGSPHRSGEPGLHTDRGSNARQRRRRSREFELARADGYLRIEGSCRARRIALQGGGSQARHHAPRQRTLPLQAHAAG